MFDFLVVFLSCLLVMVLSSRTNHISAPKKNQFQKNVNVTFTQSEMWHFPHVFLGQRSTENPDKDRSGAKRQQRPIAAIHQSHAVSNSLCSVWPSSDVTAVVLTASGRPLVTGRPPGLVHLVPHQQWPWNSIRWPHTPLHKQVRAHTHSLQLTLINGPDIQRVTHSQSRAAEALLSFYITVVWKRLTSSLLARKKINLMWGNLARVHLLSVIICNQTNPLELS